MPVNPLFSVALPEAPKNDHLTLAPSHTSHTDPIVTKVKRGLNIFAGTDVDPDWDQFIGQDLAKEQLILSIESAQNRGVKLDHTLLASGIAGVGKSTLAKLTAFHMGVGLIECSGPLDVDEFKKLLDELVDGDILFIDEIHSLGKRANYLLPYMQDGVLLTAQGEERMPQVTILGATTDSGKLPEALLTRFVIQPQIAFYTPDEGARICEALSWRMKVDVPEEMYPKIALGASNNPRVMRKILSTCRDQISAGREVDLDKAFMYAGLSHDGLDDKAQSMLITLLGMPRCTASLATLAAVLGEPGPQNLTYAERSLLARGLVTVGAKGRTLTARGSQRAKELLEG